MKWWQVIAAPVALVYGAAVAIRNGLYRTHVLHTHAVDVPTICVGNLAVGGTGKTPMVEWLIRLLDGQYKVAVLSRGYGRKTRGFVLAGEDATADTIGDEPMQVKKKFPHIAVAVCKDRVEGVRKLKQQVEGLQVVLLDDAMQYRKLRSGFTIMLTPYDRLWIEDWMLPMGRLRDLKRESLRANAVVVTKCPEGMRPIDQRVVDNRLKLPAYQQLYFSGMAYEGLPEGKRVLAVTGIARPEYLVEALKKRNNTVGVMAYRDHHRYTQREGDKIWAEAQQWDVVVTTEKDAVRLSRLSWPEAWQEKCKVVGIRMTMNNESGLERQVYQYIHENLHPKK